jgi:hypothetical protein
MIKRPTVSVFAGRNAGTGKKGVVNSKNGWTAEILSELRSDGPECQIAVKPSRICTSYRRRCKEQLVRSLFSEQPCSNMHRTNSCPSLYQESAGLPNLFWLIGVDAPVVKRTQVKISKGSEKCTSRHSLHRKFHEKKLWHVEKNNFWSWKIAIH